MGAAARQQTKWSTILRPSTRDNQFWLKGADYEAARVPECGAAASLLPTLTLNLSPEPDKKTVFIIPGDSTKDVKDVPDKLDVVPSTGAPDPSSGPTSVLKVSSHHHTKYIPIVPSDTVERVRRDINSKSRELFSECQVEVKKFLSEAPFREFRMSMYFHRYLQWKYLERLG